MKKLFGIITLLLLLTSCTQYQVKRDIKNYEAQQGKTIESIEVKRCGSDYLWAAKIRYKTCSYPKVTVYKVFSWDQYDYIREWNDPEMKKENLSYTFPEYQTKKTLITILSEFGFTYLKNLACHGQDFSF